MDAAGRLSPLPSWIEAPATRSVLQALTAEGRVVRFCGGCVRDAVLGLEHSDLDLATPDEPPTVVRLIERAGLKAVPTGIEHGTVTAVVEGRHFEITTLRRDIETFGRHARVAFTDDWLADAARRDFTINALYADPDGTLYDPFAGRADLVAGRVRFVGEARLRIEEDVLRILRYFRFHQRFGRGPPEAAALAACRELAHLLPLLSGERVRAELFRILIGPDPAASVALMRSADVLRHILPEAMAAKSEAGVALARLARLEEGERLAPNAPRRLAILLPAERAAAEAVARRLRLANAEAERLGALAARDEQRIEPGAGPAARRLLLYRLGALIVGDLVLIAWAEWPAGRLQEVAGFRAWLSDAETWQRPVLPVSGKDALSLGLPPGREVGELLAKIESWWIEGDFRADRAACLAELARLIAVGTRT